METGKSPTGETKMAPRIAIAEQFLASAKDMGDEVMIASARRVLSAAWYPRTKPCTDWDRANFIEWQNQ